MTDEEMLKAQAAEIERLAEDKRWIIDERDRTFALMLSMAEEAEAEIERLRGDLAKAQGALHQIAGKKDYADDPWDIARTTLAELTGDKP